MGLPLWRSMCTAADPRNEPREAMEYDLVIVGAGPAGLSAAIRMKQLAAEADKDVSVCVVEKAAEVGNHILSGNVFEPRALNELLPEWKDMDAPLRTPVSEDKTVWLTEGGSELPLPVIPWMHNEGNYIISLGELCVWLAGQAEELGVEIYPGFAASEPLYENGRLVGVATNDFGIAKDGSVKDTFMRGLELRGKQTVLAEGCRGSVSKGVIARHNLAAESDPQTYALGLKEVWQVDPSKHREGSVMHTMGHPLDLETYGGSFMYHAANNLVYIGFVMGLDYANPYLSPYQEFQRWKNHKSIRSVLEGGQCVSYGARTLNEGGLQSIPKLTFPGGVLVGCSAGFLNVPKIKGTHTAMKSGMVAAESLFPTLVDAEADAALENGEVAAYESAMRDSWVWEELHAVRNIHPSFKYGVLPGMVYSGLEAFILKGRGGWTLRNAKPDHEKLKPASEYSPIEYPKPDGEVTFDILESVYRSGTNHDHDQPAHLRLKDDTVPTDINLQKYAGPESRFCPAKVYEFVDDKLVINAQNCLHCKACDIKDPTQNIQWTVPEGGGGPGYAGM